jgi:hypothetical protein
MFGLIVNNEFVREVNLFGEYPNTSFPSPINPSDLPEGVVFVEDDPIPLDQHILITGYTVANVDGVWKRSFDYLDITEQLAVEKREMKWTEVRKQRDELMAEMDWRILRYQREVRLELQSTDDITVLDQYMQSLADITNQEDPFNIVWPEKP